MGPRIATGVARPGRQTFRSCREQNWVAITLMLLTAAAIPLPHWAVSAAESAPSCDSDSQESAVINFFLHDDLDATPRATAFSVVKSISSPNRISNSNLFGAIAVFDDSITEGPDVNSTELARGRGFYVFDYLEPGSTSAALEFVFTAIFNNQSDYDGSTITFKGYDKIDDVYREIAIVGGTGVFRLARGWAGIYTFASNGGSAILNTTCYVYYGCNYGVSSQAAPGARSAKYLMAPLSVLIVLNVAFCGFLFGCHRIVFKWK